MKILKQVTILATATGLTFGMAISANADSHKKHSEVKMTEEMKEAFGRFDRDKNERLSVQEYSNFLVDIGFEPAPAQSSSQTTVNSKGSIDMAFKRADKNQDNYVSKDEFAMSYKAQHGHAKKKDRSSD